MDKASSVIIALLFMSGIAFAFGSATVFGKRGLKNINYPPINRTWKAKS